MNQEEFDQLAALGILEQHTAGKQWHSDKVPEMNHEPERVVWLSEVGYPCVLSRNHSGAWCGYVGLPPEHVVAGHSARDLDVHGGVTYGPSPAKWPQALSDADPSVYVGFDCNHAGDFSPGLDYAGDRGQYRTVAYAREECEKLARQLKALDGPDSVDSADGLG